MTTATFKLIKGTKSLDLMAGRYLVAEDFVPPAPATRPTLARGSSANRYAEGTRVVGVNVDERDFTFGLHVLGASEWENRRGIADVQAFLSLAGDESEPLYLEFKPNSDTPAPLWGQDGTLFYEILHGWAGVSELYAQTRDAALPQCAARLIVKGVAVGRRQRLCTAKGAAREDDIGKNFSRGLVVQDGALTNLFTNPVFGSSTYDTGWTTAAALVSEKNTDEDFILFGAASARLYCITTATGAFTQSLTLAASTHVLSCYAKREDGAAVTASDLKIIYNAIEQTTTFVSIGDGWYLLQASVTGTGGAAATGVSVQYPRQVYVDGFQVLAAADQRPFFYGDQLGCAWSGTAHASTSTQTATVLTITADDDTLREAQGCVRIVWRPHLANTASLTTQYLFSSGASGLNAYYQASDDKFYFTDGTTTISTAAQTFGAFNILFLHFVWGPSGIAIYKDGASAASSASFDPVAAATLYLLCNSSSAQQAVCTAMDFTVFGVELTATQVSDDYTNLTQIASDVERVGALPWLWTIDGNGVVDNCLDESGSTGAPHRNYAVGGGIPGSAAGETEWEMGDDSTANTMYVGLWAVDEFVDPSGILFHEQSGTAGAVTDSSANYLLTAAVGTTGVSIATSTPQTLSAFKLRYLLGREFLAILRGKTAAAASLQAALRVDYNSTVGAADTYTGDYRTTNIDSNGKWVIDYTFPLFIPAPEVFLTDSITEMTDFRFQLMGKHTTGSGDVQVDYFCLLPMPFAIFYRNSLTRGNRQVRYETATTANLQAARTLTGKIMNLEPGQYNIVIGGNAFGSNVDVSVTDDWTIAAIRHLPRYALL